MSGITGKGVGLCSIVLASATLLQAGSSATQVPSVERGRKALLEKNYNPTTLPRSAYDDAWKVWGLPSKPPAQEYDRLFRERYGLHEAPYPNQGLPMGLKEAPMLFGLGQGLGQDCLICHGGSIAGKSYIGLGNASLDYHLFHEEITAAGGTRVKPPFQFCNVRGTSEAGGMSVFLLGYRTPSLGLRLSRLELGLHDDLCEDTPAWWLLKKKKTMYHTGGADSRSVRSLMQFMMSPLNGPEAFVQAEADFRDIQALLFTLEAPPYPLPIDDRLASQGEKLFRAHCSRCHGTYGPEGSYPNKIIPLDEIGTDRRRYDGITREFGEYYAKSWFAREKPGWLSDGYSPLESAGYQAPPLDGIWATAPYLHNGSVPTVYHLLNSQARPRIFTRSYRTDLEAYDARRLGWKVEVLPEAPDPATREPAELRKIYDTTQVGRGNGGHTFGDLLSDAERYAIIEYLKKL